MEKQIREIISQHVGGTYEAKQRCADEILRLLGVVGRSEQLCDHPISERSYIGQNMLRCKVCGKEFS